VQGVKKLLYLLGVFLTIASVWFVCKKINLQMDAVKTMHVWNLQTLHYVSICVLVYFFALNLLGVAWWCQLQHLEAKAGLGDILALYAKSQLAKYLPGNVFQYVGRNLFALKHNISQAKIIQSTLYEILSLLVAALLITLPLSIYLYSQFTFENLQTTGKLPDSWVLQFLTPNHAWIVSCILIFACCVLIQQRKKIPVFSARFLKSYLLSYAGYAFIFHLLAIFVFMLIWHGWLNQSGDYFLMITLMFAYLLSWLIGFVVPGAPGGIGVREATLILLLGSFVQEQELITLATMSRLVSVVAECLFFFEGVLIEKTSNQ